jgi:hypothetical protein
LSLLYLQTTSLGTSTALQFRGEVRVKFIDPAVLCACHPVGAVRVKQQAVHQRHPSSCASASSFKLCISVILQAVHQRHPSSCASASSFKLCISVTTPINRSPSCSARRLYHRFQRVVRPLSGAGHLRALLRVPVEGVPTPQLLSAVDTAFQL